MMSLVVSEFARIRIGARITVSSMPSLESWRLTLIHMLAEPVLSALLYLFLSGMIGCGGHDARSIVAVSLAAVFGSCSISTSLTVSEALAWDRFEGTMPFIALASRHAISVWIGRIGMLCLISLVSNMATLFITLALVDVTLLFSLPWLMVVLMLFVVLFSSVGFGVAIASLSMLMNDIYTIPNILSALLPIIGGVVAPVQVFPSLMQYGLSVLPIAHVTTAVRAMSSNLVASASFSIINALITGICWALLGCVIWRLSFAVQRKRGTLTNLGI